MIKCAYKNILESSTVSLGTGTEDPSCPLYRLYDRGTKRMFRPTGAGTLEIKIDQGAAGPPQTVDRLLIPSGHNLEGMTLSIGHSDDGVAYTLAVPSWAAPAGLIEKSWAPASKRYWKFTITSVATVPELSELFLAQTHEWERNPARPAGPFDPVFNVEHSQTASGADRFLVHGGAKRQRRYHMPRCGEAQKENVVALNGEYGGSAPFWLCDHEGDWIFGRLRGPLNLREVGYRAYSFDFDFMEVIS